jgi:hypothetical protein
MFAVDDIHDTLARLRPPSGIILALAEQLS